MEKREAKGEEEEEEEEERTHEWNLIFWRAN